MSHQIRRTDDLLGLEAGLEALHATSEFEGPVESVDEHDSYDHLALIYESRAEQFATVIPYLEHGLERGERCVYIADENDTEAILSALRDADVDADAALESGALTMHTAQDSYLRNGAFDPDEMIAFLEDAIKEATEQYEGLRIAGEMTWVFGDDPRSKNSSSTRGNSTSSFRTRTVLHSVSTTASGFPRRSFGTLSRRIRT